MHDQMPVTEAGPPAPPGVAAAVLPLPAAVDPEVGADLAAVLEEREARIAAQTEELQRLQEELAALRQQTALAVTKYRDALLSLHPDVPQELVQGETLDAVEASFTAARQSVAAIRQHLQSQAAALRVPAGAPVRSGADLSSLSPQQKIVLGLQQRRAG